MDKLFVLFLNLLIVVHAAANKIEYGKFSILEEFESLHFEEEIEVEDANIPSRSSRDGKVLVNVDSFGAAGDGISDDTQVHIHIVLWYFGAKFQEACYENVLHIFLILVRGN